MRPAPALPTLLALALSARALAQPVPPPPPPPAQGPGLPATGPDQPPPPPPGTERPAPAAAPEPAAQPAPASAPVPPPPLSPGLARLAGKVALEGLAPKPSPLPVSRDLKICGATRPDETLLLGPGGALAQAVVSIPGFPPKPGQKRRIRLDQRGCQYVPHLIAVAAGAELDVVNSDPVLHNVHARDGEATAFNYAMPVKDYRIPRKLPRAQILRVSCDVHPWMSAVVDVLDTTAFAVTDAQGSYFLDVPPGNYAVKVWHEKLGERTIQVQLSAGQTLRQDVALTPR